MLQGGLGHQIGAILLRRVNASRGLTLERALGFKLDVMTDALLTIGKVPALRTGGGRACGLHRQDKALGLTLEEIREVVRVATDGTLPCEHVRATLSRRLREVEIRIAELKALPGTRPRAPAQPEAPGRPFVRLRDHRIPPDVGLGRDPVEERGPRPEWNELVRAIKSDTLAELP